MLAWRNPKALAEVHSSKLTLRRQGSNQGFVGPPLIAVEEVDGKLVVRAIGDSALAMSGKAGFRVVNPFESCEPFLAEFDSAVAIFSHSLKELFRSWSVMTPRLALYLPTRHSVLSDEELKRCSVFADRIGVSGIEVLLGRSMPPDAQQTTAAQLLADHMIKPVTDRE